MGNRSNKACSVPGCGWPAWARGLCTGHLSRFKQAGDVQADKPIRGRAKDVPCKIPGCGRRGNGGYGWCNTHYERWRLHGDEAAGVPVRPAAAPAPRLDGASHPPRPPRGALRLLGSGRSRSQQGYIVIRLLWDDPLVSMADAHGRVFEHRLVMARHLGRPLTDTETVHHINGERDDNRLENLQLRRTVHGNGQQHRCRDCGSTNIEAVPL